MDENIVSAFQPILQAHIDENARLVNQVADLKKRLTTAYMALGMAYAIPGAGNTPVMLDPIEGIESISKAVGEKIDSLKDRAEAWDALDAHTQLVNSGAEDITEARKRLNRAIDKVRNNG